MYTQFVNPPTLRKPRGYAHAALVQGGRTYHISGQTAHDADGKVVGPGDLAAQFRYAVENIRRTLDAVGGTPQHVVKLTIYVRDRDDYLAKLREIGAAYRSVFGDHYPAMTLVGVAALWDEDALVEVEATAVLPD